MKNKKPELVTTAATLEEVERVFEAGADAVTLGHERYALRQPGHFELEQIKEAQQIARKHGGRVYAVMNALMHHDEVGELAGYLEQLAPHVDAVVFGDPSVLMTARQVAPELPLHWNTETTSTNYRTVNFWAGKGASRAILARELSLEAVLEVKRNTRIEIQVQVHGMTCIFHSKRELVSNYVRHQGKDPEQEIRAAQRRMFLKEDNREDQRYPIFEDRHGTHIMSAEDICMLEHLSSFITGGIDALKIEGILKPLEYIQTVVSIYRKAIDRLAENPHADIDSGWLDELKSIQDPARPLGTGFYFKQQIY
ncbi:U32 family peptidase [Brevibacillus sp. SYP-B805]|uniref:peptidase U32 family protein n=1 Tax=Brevibacillus sp. SYP-B805 TaxID=1578199 RepID=UPI0013EC7E01|nr:peptidase U32 family protein [Brevibacillus sp. SYP-B805]NGQ95886.1 U32 family peptidase [Brevibacillus sp. SYP-B805]